MEQNIASKRKVGHCDKTMLQIFFHFTILNTYLSLIFHAKIHPQISSGSGEVYLVVFAIFSKSGHLIYFDLTQFYTSETLESGHAPCEISEL